ncbi:hypothetical protein [Actinomycetospora cinnamomea]|uniref:Uncharacterized protein n=1 Tax=Actinomycetospora cinnamomea TaxID=663609 RepID=A0A2U1EXF1_9PSEU|nr:hypothetical protein [Actinomycetospora cinnamomea]PVZ04607.1 hypothetical protein C8D89_11760 [Actinomycetospora cinnamomea]
MAFSARRVLLASLLVVAAVIWVRINKPVEGRTLLELTSNHGVTTADLLSLVALAMAVVIAWPSRSAPQPPRVPVDGRRAPGPGYAQDRTETYARGQAHPSSAPRRSWS